MALEMASHWSSAVTQRADWSGAHPRHCQNVAVAEGIPGPPLSLSLPQSQIHSQSQIHPQNQSHSGPASCMAT